VRGFEQVAAILPFLRVFFQSLVLRSVVVELSTPAASITAAASEAINAME
jgi:hypothetical protein